MIDRPVPLKRIHEVFKAHPIAAVLGPRQCGKTTLAGMFREGEPRTFFDLENPVDVQRLAAPMTALQRLSGLVVIDEIGSMELLSEKFIAAVLKCLGGEARVAQREWLPI